MHGMGREGKDGHVPSRPRLALSNGPDRIKAVHLRHLQIHEDNVEIAIHEGFEQPLRPSSVTITEWPKRSSIWTATI